MTTNRSTLYIVAGMVGIAAALFMFVDGRQWWNVVIPGALGTILVVGGVWRRRL